MNIGKKNLVFIFILLTAFAFGQKEKNFWYFGHQAGLNFSSGAPVSVTGGQTQAYGGSQGEIEGTAVGNDPATGQMLFYSDGRNVWDKTHTKMPNGTNLWGDWSSTQSALAIKQPGSNTNYYLITASSEVGYNNVWGGVMNKEGVRYSIIDMTMNSGKGDVKVKNKKLVDPADEKITAVPHCNGIDYWIIAHKWGTSQFYCYLLSSSGLDTIPVISSAGIASGATLNATRGALKASFDGTKLVMLSQSNPPMVQFFDFCNSTGKVSNGKTDQLKTSPKQEAFVYGASFSPDNSKVYVSCWNDLVSGSGAAPSILYQYDISNWNQAAINASRTIISTSNTDLYGGLQHAPDGKIYLAQRNQQYLSAITNPNALGAACGFVVNAVSLSGYANFGLPNFVDALSNLSAKPKVDLGADITTCSGPITLDAGPISTGCGNGTYSWSTGATTQTIIVSNAGTYWVKVTACGSDTDAIKVNIGSLAISLGNDVSLCTGSATLDPGNISGATYSWSTGATTQTIAASTPGNYWVEVDLNGCKSYDTLAITAGSITLNVSDATVCANQYTIDAGITNSVYLWSTGATTQTITVNNTGSYWIEVTQGNCKGRDTVDVTLGSLAVNIGGDTSICSGPLTVGQTINGATYLWNNGATSPTINVNNSGVYFVEVTLGTCAAYDTIDVQFGQLSIDLGDDVSLCATQHQLTASGNAASYLWNTGATTQSITVTQSGTYFINVANGSCAGTDTVDVTLASAISVNLGADTVFCGAVNIQLNAGNPGSDYIWSNGSTGQSVAITTPGTYMVAVSNGLCMDRDTVSILAFDPNIDLAVASDLCDMDEIVLDAGNPGATFLWNTGATTQSISVQDSGFYWVDVKMGNCVTSDTVKVEGPFGEPVLFVPNCFTPNRDGKNDLFTAYATDITDFNLTIYNRWGNKFFETNDIYRGWDGKYNGELVPLDVYVWIVEYKTICGREQIHREIGHVSIMR